jgi:hypothetical protein
MNSDLRNTGQEKTLAHVRCFAVMGSVHLISFQVFFVIKTYFLIATICLSLFFLILPFAVLRLKKC